MISKTLIYLTLTLSIGFLAGCASSPTGSSEPSEASTPQVAAQPEIVDDYEGDGMELPLDGTSMEAWDASMARIKRHSDEASYKSLNAAVGYLLVYDLEARGNKEILISKLDGKTGNEIMGMVGWQGMQKDKSSATKTAPDAEMIDT
jgi:hypothetical protein